MIGLQLSLSSLALGHRTALCVHRWLLREGRPGGGREPHTAEPQGQPRDSQDQPAAALRNGGTSHEQPGQQSGVRPRAPRNLLSATQQPNRSIELAAVEPAAPRAAPCSPLGPPAKQHCAQVAPELRTQEGRPATVAERNSRSAETRDGAERRWSLEEAEEGLPGSGDIDEETREDVAEEKISRGAVGWCGATSAFCLVPRTLAVTLQRAAMHGVNPALPI